MTAVTVLSEHLERARRLLAGAVAVTDLDVEPAACLQGASAQLLDTRLPPAPMAPQPPSTNLHGDLVTVLDLLEAEAARAAPATESIRLAVVIRYVQDALAQIPATGRNGVRSTGPAATPHSHREPEHG